MAHKLMLLSPPNIVGNSAEIICVFIRAKTKNKLSNFGMLQHHQEGLSKPQVIRPHSLEILFPCFEMPPNLRF